MVKVTFLRAFECDKSDVKFQTKKQLRIHKEIIPVRYVLIYPHLFQKIF